MGSGIAQWLRRSREGRQFRYIRRDGVELRAGRDQRTDRPSGDFVRSQRAPRSAELTIVKDRRGIGRTLKAFSAVVRLWPEASGDLLASS